jgi:hypothetical protein
MPITSLIIPNINNSLLELPSRHPAVEQDIQLAVGELIDLGGGGCGHVVAEIVDGAHADAISLDLLAEVVELAFDVVEAAILLGEGSLEGGCLWVQLRIVSLCTLHPSSALGASHISELHDTQLSQGRNDLAANLVGHVELGQRHVRRAEKRILFACHVAGSSLYTAGEATGR